MVSFKLRLRKRWIIAAAIAIFAAAVFVYISIIQWTRLFKEEYFYGDVRKLYERLDSYPKDLNIVSIDKIRRNADTSGFKFVVMGDNRGHHGVFKRALDDAMSHKPDFIIHLGDLSKDGKLRHYKRELTFIEKNISIPFVFVVGNHDYSSNGFISYSYIFGPLDFYFDIGKYRFICIDNNFIEKVEEFVHLPESDMEWEAETGIDDEKMGKLEMLLQEEGHLNLIFMHQPPPLGAWAGHSFGENGKSFIELVERYTYAIPYVCASHIHGFDEKKLGATTFIITEGLGAKLNYEIEGIDQRYNYVLFEVDATGIRSQVCYIRK